MVVWRRGFAARSLHAIPIVFIVDFVRDLWGRLQRLDGPSLAAVLDRGRHVLGFRRSTGADHIPARD